MRRTVTRIIKARVQAASFDAIRIILATYGAHCTGLFSQQDLIYRHTDNPMSLAKLRYVDGSPTVVHFYTEQLNKTFVEFTSRPATRKTQNELVRSGYILPRLVKKQREKWKLNNLVMHLDTIDQLGSFFEIENDKYHHIPTVAKDICRALDSLFIETSQLSNAELLVRHR